MAKVYAYDGVVPVVDASAFVHPEAVLIGDAHVGPGAYIGPGAILRGDFGRVVVGENANLQETCVMHAFPNKDVVIEERGHVGHGAVLHGCRVGENAMVGAGAMATKDVRPFHVNVGVPAKSVRVKPSAPPEVSGTTSVDSLQRT